MIEFIAGYVAGVLTLVLAMLLGEQLRRRAAIEMGESEKAIHGIDRCGVVEDGLTCALVPGHKAEHLFCLPGYGCSPPGSIIPIDAPLAHYGVDGAIHRGPSYSCGLCERITQARKL